jgi:integrase
VQAKSQKSFADHGISNRLIQLPYNRKQLDEHPLEHIAIPKSAKKKINIYTDIQCRRILKAAQEYAYKWNPEKSVKWDLVIVAALTTAMRRAELLNCTWADVDFDAQTIEVTPKKNARDTWQWLIKDADHRTLSDPRLKVVNNMKRSFDKILRKAGVKKGTFHDIRRTALSNWFTNGMSEHDVMTLAGHSSFATTHKFYLAVADDLVDRARQATAQSFSRNLLQHQFCP